MATELTKKALLLSRKTNPEPQLILEIDGIQEIFGALPVQKNVLIGDPELIIDDPPVFFIGGVVNDNNSRDWIDLKGSTKALTQQISNDSTGLASFQAMRVKIIDKDKTLSRIFSPGFEIDDILSTPARVYLNFVGGGHPVDSTRVISGLVDAIEFGPGHAIVSVSHPENLKRQRIFPQISRVVQNQLDYNSITIQDIFFKRRNQLREVLSIEYLNTTAAGSETATLTGTKITVNIQSGVSTADQIEEAIRASSTVSSIVETDVVGTASTAQTAFAETSFLITTTITLDNASEHIPPIDMMRTYVKVEDEIIEFTGISGNDLTGCVRGQLRSLAINHDAEEEAETFYRLEENPIVMALKLLLSDGGNPYKTGIPALRFNQVDSETFVQNAIFFNDSDIQETLGLVQGDLLRIDLADEAGNNFLVRNMLSFVKTDTGSYIIVDGANLIDEVDSPAIATFTSQYNVMPKNIGLQMNPLFVDVKRHEGILDTFAANFPDYDLYVKEEKEGSGFINKEIYLPVNLFAIPREGKVSLNIIKPPLNDSDTKTFNKDNIKKPEDIINKRTINNKFYNAITYRYEEDALEDKFLGGTIVSSASSESRIPIGIRDLTVDSPGIRRSPTIDNLLRNNGTKQILRYRFGAEVMQLSVLFRDGFNVDVGDTIILDGDDLNITDTGKGNRNFEPRLMEVGNKSIDFKSGDVKLEVINTAFNLDGRFGTIGPSSKLSSGSTTTIIRLKRSFGTNALTEEIVKWTQFVGLDVRVRSKDLTFDETVNFVSLSQTVPNSIVVFPALSLSPAEDYILDMPVYTPTESIFNALWRSAHCYLDPSVSITAGVSTIRFTVGAGDIAKFQIGAFIRVHNDDFTQDSGDTTIINIIGNDIITTDDLGFTPTAANSVELIGFADGGKPYRIL